MLNSICVACQYGYHDSHINIIQVAPPGLLGGVRCTCKGECVDGRYKSDQIKQIMIDVEKFFNKETSTK